MQTNCIAQSNASTQQAIDTTRPYGKQYENAQFCGGDDSLNQYITDHTIFPETAWKEGIQGRTTVQFLIDERGSISHIKVIRGIGGACDSEVVKVLQEMPLWEPATYMNIPIRSVQTLRITFKLE